MKNKNIWKRTIFFFIQLNSTYIPDTPGWDKPYLFPAVILNHQFILVPWFLIHLLYIVSVKVKWIRDKTMTILNSSCHSLHHNFIHNLLKSLLHLYLDCKKLNESNTIEHQLKYSECLYRWSSCRCTSINYPSTKVFFLAVCFICA